MCVTCGCGGTEVGHDHSGHAYTAKTPRRPAAAGETAQTRRISVERDILARNDAYAARNRMHLARQGVFALNLLSSPGSGKTTLLAKTIERLQGSLPVKVIEGDQQTRIDAERIEAAGAQAVQINTGKGCHLDADRVGGALAELGLAGEGDAAPLSPQSPQSPLPPVPPLLIIENVGNLVCPAAFDLGEACKVVILSVTEGDDKPLKYPDIFAASRLMLISKCDLLPYVPFDVECAVLHARRVNPEIEVMQLSALTGAGMEAWQAWLLAGAQAARAARAAPVPEPAANPSRERTYHPV